MRGGYWCHVWTGGRPRLAWLVGKASCTFLPLFPLPCLVAGKNNHRQDIPDFFFLSCVREGGWEITSLRFLRCMPAPPPVCRTTCMRVADAAGWSNEAGGKQGLLSPPIGWARHVSDTAGMEGDTCSAPVSGWVSSGGRAWKTRNGRKGKEC